MNLYTLIESPQHGALEILKQFPGDLVDLVLSAPAAGTIAGRVKSLAQNKHIKNGTHPATLLKQIRRTCIELRLIFWPGLSMDQKPIPCIPCGDDDWRIGESSRVLSKQELVSYLSRYGIITHKQV
jgi:hypothetical protein